MRGQKRETPRKAPRGSGVKRTNNGLLGRHSSTVFQAIRNYPVDIPGEWYDAGVFPPRDIWTYLCDVFGHWQAYATGGGVTALILVYERLVRPIPKRLFSWIVLVFFLFAATFAAWRDAYLSMKGREADNHRLEIELIDAKKSRPIAEDMRQGFREAFQDTQKPAFTSTAYYNPSSHEITMTLVNSGPTVALSVNEGRWIEVGKLSFTPRLDRAKPDVKFTPFYTTKRGFTVIPGFVPTANFIGGSEDLRGHWAKGFG